MCKYETDDDFYFVFMKNPLKTMQGISTSGARPSAAPIDGEIAPINEPSMVINRLKVNMRLKTVLLVVTFSILSYSLT